MASTYLNKTFGTPTSTQKCTHSFWFKLGSDFTEINFSGMWDNYYSFDIVLDSSSRFRVYSDNTTPTKAIEYVTNRVLRDPSAWYHAVVSIDTTQSGGNRVKIYINGVQETSFATTFEPNQNDSVNIVLGTHSAETSIGRTPAGGGGNYFDGSITHYHYVDGTAYDADTFGETDATTGIWKPKTAPSVTYGNNGFFLKFENSGAFGTDSSGNANNFTVNGTMTQTIDTPSNVFCTLNPLTTDSGVTLSNGNTESDYDASVGNAKGTLAFSSGKYYWEVKIATSASSYPMLGIGSVDEAQMQQPTGGSYPGGFTNSYGAYGNGNVYANGSNTGSQGFTWTTNDIIGIAVDLDSATKTIKWFKNGSEIASYNITNVVSFASIDYNGAEASVNLQYNFGNGYFGTTAVSSAENPDDGIGIFEHTPPTGYKALCTKSINAQEYD